MKKKAQISFWKHYPIADQKAISLANESLLFQEKFNCDFIKITPAGTWQAVCQGAKDESWENDNLGRRRITIPNIQTLNDWQKLPDLSISKPSLMQEMISSCNLIFKQNNTTPIFFTVFCPITQAIQMAGLETFLQHVEEDPEMVLTGLAIITKNTLYIIEEYKKAGAKGMFFVTQHMRHGALSPEIYRKFGESFNATCLNNCKNFAYTIFHIHGEDIYLTTDNLPSNCILHYESSVHNPTMEDLQKQYPHQIIMGIPATEMAACTTEETIKKAIIPYLEANKHTNMLFAGCVIPLDFSDEQLLLWIKVAKEM